MIFVGDVALACNDSFKYCHFPSSFFSDSICLNLEGSLYPSLSRKGLKNSVHWLDSFSDFDSQVVFLANNHFFDPPSTVDFTLDFLKRNDVDYFGILHNSNDLPLPLILGDIALLGFGWHVIGCKNDKNISSLRINNFNPANIFRQVKYALSLPDLTGKKLICVFHWNYEFEEYPQPAHRQLALDLIDLGVYAVIGHHPHIIGPVERYKHGFVAYSVGNWMFSYSKHFNGNLSFPPKSFKQLAISVQADRAVAHIINFCPPNQLVYQFSQDIDSDQFSLAPSFEGFSHKQYISWFSANRRKKFFLPIYKNYSNTFEAFLYDAFVYIRQKFIDFIVFLNLKSLKRST